MEIGQRLESISCKTGIYCLHGLDEVDWASETSS